MRAGIALACALLAVPAAAEVTSARYSQPTTRYDHGVLGDAVEWGALDLSLDDGRTLRFSLPETMVFEDLTPRLADLDGDGAPEVIVVESSVTDGARLAVWGEAGRIAATAHYGQRNRWLAPVGAADLDGDGRVEIAYVDRPHLARVLRILRLEGGRLTELASTEGLTNHRIGDAFIQGGIAECGEGPVIFTATADWSGVAATTFSAGTLSTEVVGRYSGAGSLARAVDCR